MGSALFPKIGLIFRFLDMTNLTFWHLPSTHKTRNVILQRTIPCTSHPEPRSKRYQGLQSTAPATKCHWCCACHTTSHCNVPFPAPATQSHAPTLPGCFNHLPPKCHQDASITCHQMSHWFCACHTTSHCNVHATYHSLHQPPRATLQRYQDASIDCACHQMSHWCCACHTTSQFNVPFPAPATQIHAATGSVTCTSEPISRVQASQFHVYKRTRAPPWTPPTL